MIKLSDQQKVIMAAAITAAIGGLFLLWVIVTYPLPKQRHQIHLVPQKDGTVTWTKCDCR